MPNRPTIRLNFRLRNILALAFILIATIPVLLLGAWVENTAMEREVASVSEKHLLLAQNLTSALDRYAEDSKSVFDFFTATALPGSPSRAEIALAREIGFQHFCLVEQTGEIIANWGISGESKDQVTRNVIQRLQPGAISKTEFSAVMLDGTGQPTIFMTRRLKSGRVAIAAISLDYIRKVQKAIIFGRKGHSAIVDQDGNVIAHPRTAWQREIKNIAQVKPVSLMMKGETGVTTFFSPAVGKDMITGYTTVPSTGWGVMVPQPMEELEARAEQVRLIALGLIAVGLVAAALIGWFLAGLLVGPVQAVARAARDLAQGNLDTRVPAYAGGAPIEYIELSSAFNGMARDVATDISERKRAERALRDSEEQIRQILNAMPIAIAYVDADERYVMVNKMACEWHARQESDIVGKRVEDLLGERYTTVKAAIRDVLRGQPGTLDMRMAYSDGITRDIRLHVAPKLGLGEEILGWFSMVEDISDRTQAEAALRESEERLRGIFENSSSAISLKDADGRYQMLNHHYKTWYGLPTDNWRGKAAHQIYSAAIAETIEAHDGNVLQSGQTTLWEADHRFPDGRLRSIVATKFPISDDDGRPAGIGSIITDVTRQRRSEAALRQAQKMESVGQLTGGIAHHFNNLLAIVIGNLDFLEDQLGDNDKLTGLVRSAMKAAMLGADLNEQLLVFSRKQSLEPKEVDLDQQVSVVLKNITEILGEAISTHVRCTEELWQCEVDPVQLEKAIVNLADNARDAMTAGGRFTIETANIRLDEEFALGREDVTPGDYVVLSVTDTGCGMRADILERVFEPFFTTKDVGAGAGLGLSMVFGFVKQSRGDVTIESVEGEGTTVRLYLPRVGADAEASIEHAAEA
jgi:PAS domain S-box-containing protein